MPAMLRINYDSYRLFKAASVVQRQRAGLWYPSSRVQTRPKPSDFSRAKKILSTPPFGREVKPFVPCRRFTSCKSLHVTWKSGIFRQNSQAISRPSSSSFHYQGLCWRHLAVQVGTTKDQGCKIRPRLQCIRGHQPPGPYHNTLQYHLFNRKLHTSDLFNFQLPSTVIKKINFSRIYH